MALSFVLRIYNLDRRGIVEHDEGHYLLASQLYSRSTVWVVSHATEFQTGSANLRDLRNTIIASGGGTQNLTAKPAHYFVVAVALWLGDFQDTAGLTPSAVFGALTIVVLFVLGQTMFDPRIALLSATVLAVSAYHIAYSRSAIPQAGSVFFDCLGVYLYYKGVQSTRHALRFLFLASLAIALAFVFHYNLFWQFGALFLYEGWRWWQEHRVSWRRLGIMLVGFALPLLIIELCFQLVRMALVRVSPALGQGLGLRTYFEQLDYQLRVNTATGFSPSMFFYPKLFWEWEGIIVCVLIVVGTFFVARRLGKHRNLSDFIVLVQFGLPLLLWNLTSSQYSRNMVVALPFAALIAAIGLVEMIGPIPVQKKYRDALLAASVVVILVIGIYRALPLVNGTASYAEAARQLRRYAEIHPGTIVAKRELGLSTDPLWRFYLGNLVDYDRAQGTVFIIDRSTYTASSGNTRALLEYTRCAREILRVKNDITWYMTGDSPTNPPESVLQQIPEANEIRLYDRRLPGTCS